VRPQALPLAGQVNVVKHVVQRVAGPEAPAFPAAVRQAYQYGEGGGVVGV
jgi:hypothetical protein